MADHEHPRPGLIRLNREQLVELVESDCFFPATVDLFEEALDELEEWSDREYPLPSALTN